MENNDVLSTLALMDGYRKNDSCGCGCYDKCGRSHNVATTGIGLAAGLGGGALLLGIAGLWGLNAASKARANGNQNAINALTNFAFMSHNNTAAWQLQHAPTISQMVDVRAGAGASSFSNAFANAESQIVADALTGRSQICPQAVSLYSAPQPCPCVQPQPCGCGCN